MICYCRLSKSSLMCKHLRNLWLRLRAAELPKQKTVWVLLLKDWEEESGTCMALLSFIAIVMCHLSLSRLNVIFFLSETGSIQTMRRDLETPLILVNQLQSNWMMLHGHILRSTGALSVLLFRIDTYRQFLCVGICSTKGFLVCVCSCKEAAFHVIKSDSGYVLFFTY